MSDCFAGRDVLDGCGAGGFAGGCYGYGNGVPGVQGDSAEVVGVVWVPFVPGVVGDGGAGFGPWVVVSIRIPDLGSATKSV